MHTCISIRLHTWPSFSKIGHQANRHPSHPHTSTCYPQKYHQMCRRWPSRLCLISAIRATTLTGCCRLDVARALYTSGLTTVPLPLALVPADVDCSVPTTHFVVDRKVLGGAGGCSRGRWQKVAKFEYQLNMLSFRLSDSAISTEAALLALLANE